MSESLRNDGRVWVPKKKGDARSPDQIVFNLPHRGNRFLFSEKGLKDNRQLYAFLEERHFGIECLRKASQRDGRIRGTHCVGWQESVFKLRLDGDAKSVQGLPVEAYF